MSRYAVSMSWRAGYPAHPAGNAAGAEARWRLDRLPVCVPSDGCACRVSLASGLGPGWHGAAAVAVGATSAGGRDRRVAVDAVRSRRELVLENAVLRHQVNGCDATASARSSTSLI